MKWAFIAKLLTHPDNSIKIIGCHTLILLKKSQNRDGTKFYKSNLALIYA